MKRFMAVLIASCALCGCGTQLPEAKTDAAAETQAAPASDAFPIPENPVPTISDADRPDSIEAFQSEFIRRYTGNMYAPFIELADWVHSTDEQKQEYLAYVKSVFLMPPQTAPARIKPEGDFEVNTIEQYDAAYYPKEGEESIHVTPEPTHVLGITGHFRDGVEVTAWFAVGVRDGKYYFCTVKDE
jgi:hypothetical protein